MASPPVISIIGKSQSGKTTLLEKLIPELKRRGYRLATIKHHAHPGFEIDQAGKDSWRHAQAGSDVAVIAAPDKLAIIQRLDYEKTLDEILAVLPEVDLVLCEGFKRAGKPAIEVVRAERGLVLVADPDQLIAIASDSTISAQVPVFNLNNPLELADFIENRFLKS